MFMFSINITTQWRLRWEPGSEVPERHPLIEGNVNPFISMAQAMKSAICKQVAWIIVFVNFTQVLRTS